MNISQWVLKMALVKDGLKSDEQFLVRNQSRYLQVFSLTKLEVCVREHMYFANLFRVKNGFSNLAWESFVN